MINIKTTDKLVFELKMLQIDYNEQKKETLRRHISEKYNVPIKNVEIIFSPITIDENGEELSLASNIINDIQDPNFQRQLFWEYIALNNINGIRKIDIEAIDNEVNSYVDFDTYRKYKAYKFKYVKWDNYLSYGKGNYYDFTKLHGLVLLNGQPENQCGKTSFSIDLLRFALFGKSDKTPTLNDVFNKFLPEETEVRVEACIEIEGKDYIIRRTVTRPSLKKRSEKSKCKQKVEYFQLVNGSYDLIENCEEETVQQTNNIIKETVGSLEDYNLVISATAYTLSDLLKMGQKDKSSLFSRWLGLMTLEEKEEVAKTLWKDKYAKRLLSNTYNKGDLISEINEIKQRINNNDEQLVLLNNKLCASNDEISKLDSEKTTLLLSIKQIKEELKNVDITTIENTISSKETILKRKKEERRVFENEYNIIKNVIFNNVEYKAKQKEIDGINQEIINCTTIREKLLAEYNNIAKDNKRIQGLIQKKICPTCGHKIEIAEQNITINANNIKATECVTRGKDNNEKLKRLTDSLDKLKNDLQQIETNRDTVHKREKLELNITAIDTQMQLINKELEDLYSKKKEIENIKEYVKKNNEIAIKIRNINAKINTEKNINNSIIKDIEEKKNENKIYSKNIEEKNTLIQKLEKEEIVIKNWKLYQQLIGKDGISKMVLKRALPIINNEIDRLLNGLCDFKVLLRITGDNKVSIDMERNNEIMDLGICASGFETTMASIALRAALCSMSSISRPNFCTMDEIIGPIGSSNYESLHELFNRMCSNYQFILHISHVEDVWDWHNTQITVYKDGNISRVK